VTTATVAVVNTASNATVKKNDANVDILPYI
jgi:hypothetical protein